jgi:hypothetical protein
MDMALSFFGRASLRGRQGESIIREVIGRPAAGKVFRRRMVAIFRRANHFAVAVRSESGKMAAPDCGGCLARALAKWLSA